jgi:hypothetical protein
MSEILGMDLTPALIQMSLYCLKVHLAERECSVLPYFLVTIQELAKFIDPLRDRELKAA